MIRYIEAKAFISVTKFNLHCVI